jgi:hypothetical protein
MQPRRLVSARSSGVNVGLCIRLSIQSCLPPLILVRLPPMTSPALRFCRAARAACAAEGDAFHLATEPLSAMGTRIHTAASTKPSVRWVMPHRIDVIATPASAGKNATASPTASATF